MTTSNTTLSLSSYYPDFNNTTFISKENYTFYDLSKNSWKIDFFDEEDKELEKIIKELKISPSSKSSRLSFYLNNNTYSIFDIIGKLCEEISNLKKEVAILGSSLFDSSRLPEKIKDKNFFWVMEKTDSEVCSPLYLTKIENGVITWDSSIYKAFRFDYEEEAIYFRNSKILEGLEIFNEVRICEHSFIFV